MNEHKIVLTDRSTLQPVVYITVLTGKASKPDKFLWRIESVCEISGFKSEEDALEGAWNAVSAVFQVLTYLGVSPSTDLVQAILRLAVQR